VWRGGLGGTYLLPTLSVAGASLFPPCFRFHTPSRPGEFHPEPLTDPCLTVSGHTARATRGRPAPSAETIGFFLSTHIDPDSVTHSLRSTRITPFHRYYGVESHASCTPDIAWPVRKVPSMLLPEQAGHSGFDVVRVRFRCVVRGSFALVSLIHT
jgi:hypothetical protein